MNPISDRFHVRYLWPVLSVVTLFTYNTWVLWHPMHSHPEIFNGYLSEFSASDQPNNFFYRGGDLITALIVLALGMRAVWLWRTHDVAARAGRKSAPSRWWLVAGAALVVFGLATFFDAFFAMDCSPSVSEQCRVLEENGQLSAVHYAHTYTSVGAQVGIVASMVATFIAMLREHHKHSRTRRWLVLGVCVVEVGALTVMMAMLIGHEPGLGYPQAVMVVMASLWFAATGFGLVGEGAREADSAPEPGDPRLLAGSGRRES